MSSKASRRRQKRAAQRREREYGAQVLETHQEAIQAPHVVQKPTNRPTPERKARGSWAIPKGGQKSQQPMVDVASDMIGQLYVANLISPAQEQAARSWQELRAAYLAEIPNIASYRSCLAGSVPGYDDGDGNPEIIAAYRGMEKALGQANLRQILWVADMNHKPSSIRILRDALDIISGP